MKWILLFLALFCVPVFAEVTIGGNVTLTGNIESGTNNFTSVIQSLRAPNSIVTGGGLIGAWFVNRGIVPGNTPTNASILFDLSGNNFHLTAVTTGSTNQLVYGVAGTNQIGTVGIPSLNCTTNASFGTSRLENNTIGPIFNIPNTGQSTNGGITMVVASRCRILGTTVSFSIGGTGGNNANQMTFVENASSASQTKVGLSSVSNATAFSSGGLSGTVTNRWRFLLMSYDSAGLLTRMDNLTSAQTTVNFATNFNFQYLSLGLRKAPALQNRYNGDIAGAMIFTNSMNDGISRTNLLNLLNQQYHFY